MRSATEGRGAQGRRVSGWRVPRRRQGFQRVAGPSPSLAHGAARHYPGENRLGARHRRGCASRPLAAFPGLFTAGRLPRYPFRRASCSAFNRIAVAQVEEPGYPGPPAQIRWPVRAPLSAYGVLPWVADGKCARSGQAMPDLYGRPIQGREACRPCRAIAQLRSFVCTARARF